MSTPIRTRLTDAELRDLMARQSLDIAIDELGTAEVLRVVADRHDPNLKPGIRPG